MQVAVLGLNIEIQCTAVKFALFKNSLLYFILVTLILFSIKGKHGETVTLQYWRCTGKCYHLKGCNQYSTSVSVFFEWSPFARVLIKQTLFIFLRLIITVIPRATDMEKYKRLTNNKYYLYV